MNQTEKNILEKAIQLFKKNGYQETSINMICDACNITKGTFYYHFNAKSNLIFYYYEYIFEDIMKIMPELITMKNPKEKLWKLYEYSIDNTVSLTAPLLNALLITDAQNSLHYFSPLQSGELSDSRHLNIKMIRELVVQAQEEGSIQKEKDPDLLIQTYSAVIIGMAMDWSSNHGNYDQKEKLQQMFEIVFA